MYGLYHYPHVSPVGAPPHIGPVTSCCCLPVCCPPRYGVAIITIAILILIALAVIF